MLTKEEATQIFLASGALMEGHFKLTSGRHSNQYMQCAQVLQYPQYTEKLAAHIAEKYASEKIDWVIGPAMGGIIVSYEVARQLKVPSIFCERQDGKMELRRGFKLEAGDKVLVVEDVVTTGGSVVEVMEIVRQSGAIVVGVAVLVDRSGGKVDFGVKTEAVLTMDIESWEGSDCPLCKAGQGEAIKPGSRS
ncbi:MAG: orotate phosphoribosyltransferase [Firmicutes bacterium HGW-Firmicutes-15]|nr:MAG: orotate phosphoribosyltransferase [Firmicutes bacterium HGW-Firmicutes-15]